MENVLKDDKKKKKTIIILCVLVAVFVIGLGSYFLFIKTNNDNTIVTDDEDDYQGVYYSKMYLYEYVSTKDKSKKILRNGDAYGDWEKTSNVYYYYCGYHVCTELDDAYPYVVIRDAGYIKLYNVLTKKETILSLKTTDIDNSTDVARIEESVKVNASDITLAYINDKMYGLICNAENNKFFYAFDDEKIYKLNNKYVYGFKNDIVDNRLWADDFDWATDDNNMWEGGKYVVDYKTKMILHNFGDTENGYPKVLVNNNKYYYASRVEVNQLSSDAYNEVLNKNFKSLLKKQSPDSFVINRVDSDGKLNILYNNEIFKLDNNGEKKVIKSFDKTVGSIIGFNFDNNKAIAIKNNAIVLLNSDNKVAKTIISDYRPAESESCNYEGAEASFSTNADKDELVDIGFLWVCEFDNYTHVTYNITKDIIETE